jgi:hypothetical protein
MENKKEREVGETVLTIIGVASAILTIALWTFVYLLTTGVINITL